MYLYALILAIVALARPAGSVPPSYPAHRKFVQMKKINNAYYQIPSYQVTKYYYKVPAASVPSIAPDMTDIVPTEADFSNIVPGQSYTPAKVVTKPRVKAPVPAKPIPPSVAKPVKALPPAKSAPVKAPVEPVAAPAPVVEAGGDSWQQTVVANHNAYRQKYGAKPLTWSDKLYPETVNWANGCNFEHSKANGAYGENLAAGSGSNYDFLDGFTAWMDEVSLYNYNNPTFSTETGHFTAVIWKSTTEVACAITECPAGTIFGQSSKYVVCRYSPPGNVLGQFIENVGKALVDGLEGIGKEIGKGLGKVVLSG
ncbi:hypothetical protein ONZ45_g9519 [Pleurotus djamor]|nr:hypothetical protein ONZ45_g9519 [Pleurotus djamor]